MALYFLPPTSSSFDMYFKNTKCLGFRDEKKKGGGGGGGGGVGMFKGVL